MLCAKFHPNGKFLLTGDLRGIVRARKLSRATMRNIKQNLFFAFVYNSLGVPIAAGALYPFFGVLLSPADWSALAQRLTIAGTEFVIAPHTRFAGQPGEQSTMFLLDPSGNALEFKSFSDDDQVFAR